MRIFLTLLLVPACMDSTVAPSRQARPNVANLDVASIDDDLVPGPEYHQLPADAPDCCTLGVVDPVAFRATCGVPGTCVDFACPLDDGTIQRRGLCLPERSTAHRIDREGLHATSPTEVEQESAIGDTCQDSCGSGLTCVSYRGFAGQKLASCEQPCGVDASCPTGLTCGIVADGPGHVCR